MTCNLDAMAATPSLREHPQAGLLGVAGTLKRWWSAYWMRRAQRSTVMILRSLDDRALHDIGIDRSEIESVVFGTPAERRLRYDSAWH